MIYYRFSKGLTQKALKLRLKFTARLSQNSCQSRVESNHLFVHWFIHKKFTQVSQVRLVLSSVFNFLHPIFTYIKDLFCSVFTGSGLSLIFYREKMMNPMIPKFSPRLTCSCKIFIDVAPGLAKHSLQIVAIVIWKLCVLIYKFCQWWQVVCAQRHWWLNVQKGSENRKELMNIEKVGNWMNWLCQLSTSALI